MVPEGAGNQSPLTGELRLLPFNAKPLSEHAVEAFSDLATDHDVQEILVIKRNPTGLESIESALTESVDGVSRPRVFSLPAHARRVLERTDETQQLLGRIEQRLLLSAFVDSYDWETPYLRRASQHESFEDDVGRFVTEATWQGIEIETDDPILDELVNFTAAFHDWLADHGLLHPSAVSIAATEALATESFRDRIRRSFNAAIVLEFEEFAAIDRQYLAQLTEDTRLLCLAERDSAIQRPWNEGGRIEDYVTSLDVDRRDRESATTGPDLVASYLATGDDSTDGEANGVSVIEAETFVDQIATIADEIERLRRMSEVEFSDCAVVLPDANAPIARTLKLLQNAGIPVSSATVSGLEHDPGARELYALVSWCARKEAGDLDVGWETNRSTALLQARVPDVSEDLLSEVVERGQSEGLEDAIYHWALETDLKARIAEGAPALDAYSQFEHVETVLTIASFLDDSPLLGASWPRFCAGLERQIERADTDKVTTDVELPTEGVLVDAVRVLKNEPRDVVFLVNVIDRDYPAEPRINALFPTPHLETLEGFPTFTTPTEADVEATFGATATVSARPLRAYHAALSRRALAIGARTASERLYLGTFREESGGTGSNHQPSRFLADVETALGPFDRLEHDAVHSFGRAVEFSLTRVEDALDDVRRAGTVGEPVDLEAVADEFASVQAFLEQDPSEELRAAIEARVDFAEGAVRRE